MSVRAGPIAYTTITMTIMTLPHLRTRVPLCPHLKMARVSRPRFPSLLSFQDHAEPFYEALAPRAAGPFFQGDSVAVGKVGLEIGFQLGTPKGTFRIMTLRLRAAT